MKPLIASVLLLCVYCSHGKNPDQNQGNPIFSDKYIADPVTLVYGKNLYLYVAEDLPSSIPSNHWLVYSTTDLKTWKKYPIPLSLKTFKWTSENDYAWASHVVEKEGKFYWYATVSSPASRSRFIGVAVSDSPTGPFIDALGKPLISNDLVWNTAKWGDVDPAVFIDDDKQAYIFWGGGRCFYAKLKDNMIEIENTPKIVNLPMYFAGPWLHKYKGKYYLSYEQALPYMIGYAVSNHIEGPWEYAGVISYNEKNNIPYQSAIQNFNGNWYFFYHRAIPQSEGFSRRSVCIEKFDYYDDGKIKMVEMTDKGIN